MIDLPAIAQQILDAAWSQLEDADYENHARVIIGGDIVLIDKEDFEELKTMVNNERGIQRFEEIVTIKEQEQ